MSFRKEHIMPSGEHYLKKELYDLVQQQSHIFEFIQSGSLDGIWYWDLENPENEWMSPRFWALFGYEPSVKKHLVSEWQDLIFPEDLKTAVDNFHKHCADPNHPYDQIVRYRHRDGSTVWVRCRGVAIRDKSGRPIRMLGAHNDLTALKEAEEDLRQSKKQADAANRSKGSFLANMSHELRSPLNSLLLLSQGLEQNPEGNLTPEQVESLKIIHSSGKDLLNLINGILDLAKIEAGRMDLLPGQVRLIDLVDGVRASFGHMAREKGLGFHVDVKADTPSKIISDRKRVEQVVRNLISNALKFTESGSVTVTFGRPVPGVDLAKSGLSPDECLAIAVKDTGIGIMPEQQAAVFDAFHQADGGTARKFGGTGLGLSISRELASLLGGEIQLESEPGEGSTFTLYLPLTVPSGSRRPAGEPPLFIGRDGNTAIGDIPRPRAAVVNIEDDRDTLKKGDRVVLVIEDDSYFDKLLYAKCHEKGFKCLVAPTGEEGLELVAKHEPAAVILDIRLPGMDGWAVLASLKAKIGTRHIPVYVVTVEDAAMQALRFGALGHAAKPLDQEGLEDIFRRLEQMSTGEPKRVLLVAGDPDMRRKIVQLIGNTDAKVEVAQDGERAMKVLRLNNYDCMVLDPGMPDMNGGRLLARLRREGIELPPVIIHRSRDLTSAEENLLRECAESMVIKDVRSPERLLDEVALFCHCVVSEMPPKQKQMILDLHETDVLLRNKKVLVVDDDMRTTFALSNLLSGKGMETLKAENGGRAVETLHGDPDVDLVLMDIMMPGMDGYEAMEKIRAQDRFRDLPIIALTAKAMPEDRARCIAAGANDFLPKPVDAGRLTAMMRLWLHK
jgi:PAS domain S-box-containing protein